MHKCKPVRAHSGGRGRRGLRSRGREYLCVRQACAHHRPCSARSAVDTMSAEALVLWGLCATVPGRVHTSLPIAVRGHTGVPTLLCACLGVNASQRAGHRQGSHVAVCACSWTCQMWAPLAVFQTPDLTFSQSTLLCSCPSGGLGSPPPPNPGPSRLPWLPVPAGGSVPQKTLKPAWSLPPTGPSPAFRAQGENLPRIPASAVLGSVVVLVLCFPPYSVSLPPFPWLCFCRSASAHLSLLGCPSVTSPPIHLSLLLPSFFTTCRCIPPSPTPWL